MDEIKDEILRLRERTHELGNETAALRLELADIKSEVRQLKVDNAKYVPIVERLDDNSIAEKAVAREAAKEASKVAALLVAGVSVAGVLVNVLVNVIHLH